jgi:riboflavin synthase
VQHIGTVADIQTQDATASGGGGWSVTISDAAPILADCHIGDSISVNGACLTVTEFDSQAGSFKVGLAPETLQRTDLGMQGQCSPSDPAVLMRYIFSRRAQEGFKGQFGESDGHGIEIWWPLCAGKPSMDHDVRVPDSDPFKLQQGHVDSTAMLVSATPDGNSVRLVLQLPESATDLLTALVPKGYVALDGTSLTLTMVDDKTRTFGVMLIAHTQEKVVLSSKKAGDKVNVEVDMVAKTVEKVVRSGGLESLIEGIVEKALAKRQL